jgi:hypothetical protein
MASLPFKNPDTTDRKIQSKQVSISGETLDNQVIVQGDPIDPAAYVQVKNVPALPTDYGNVVRQVPFGSPFAITRDDIAGTSINIAFGFIATYVEIDVHEENGDDLICSWLGGTAVVPSNNTAGHDRLRRDRTYKIPISTSSISVKSGGSNTLIASVRAFK